MKWILIILLFSSTKIFCQDQDSLFSEIKTLSFARHLYINGMYDMASQEYERLIYINPKNKIYHKELLASYRKSNNIKSILKKSKNEAFYDSGIQLEYALGNFAAGNFETAKYLLVPDTFSTQKHRLIAADIKNCISLLEFRILPVGTDNQNPVIENLSIMYRTTKTKSPVKAGIFSAVIPGSGRVYTQDYTNGLLSLLFIGGSAWQSASRFKQNGITSVTGWIYGGIAFSFYLGNIYGSVKSAKKYNNKKYQILDEKTKNYILNLDF